MSTLTQITAWRQLAAFIYDLFPITGILLTTSIIGVLVRNEQDIESHSLPFQLLFLAEIMLYYLYSWKKGGQTLGMRAWKIGLVNYQQSSWLQMLARFAVGLLSTALLGMGLWWQYVDKSNRSWMDMVSSTRVISTQPIGSKQQP